MIKFENHGSVALLRLENGVTNAINPRLVDQVHQTLREVRGQFQGLVLSGGSKFFSIGFDLPSLLPLDRTAMASFFHAFDQLLLELLTLPLPTACAVGGHAIAGGNILALTGDFRYAATGKKLLGLNEVRLGVPVPYLADLMLRQLVGDRAATMLLFTGELLTIDAAEEIGLVDKQVAAEELESYAVKKIAELAVLPGTAFAAVKANRVEAIHAAHRQHGQAKNETFLDCWFSPPVQALLHEAAKRF